MKMISTLAHRNLPTSRSPARKPRISSGTELAIRWPKPPCRNGAKTMPTRPSGSQPTMPNCRSSEPPRKKSTPSTAHITTSMPTTMMSALRAPENRAAAPRLAGSNLEPE